MRYFRINTMGNIRDRSLAFIDQPPDGLGLQDFFPARGRPVTEHYPEDAKIYLQSKSPGIKLSSLLGNTISYLIVHTAMKDVIAAQHKGEIEILPFTLYNHKKRVHSKDYWIVNPIGTIDCVNKEASEITYGGDGNTQVVGVDKWVLDPKKLEAEPALFRVPENPEEYFINARLGKAFQENKFTNVLLTEVETKESK